MGSRLSNTSWCWSPRDRAPEHDPHPEYKSSEQRWNEKYERNYEKQVFDKWWDENRWKYVQAKDPDIGSIGETYTGEDMTDREWWNKN